MTAASEVKANFEKCVSFIQNLPKEGEYQPDNDTKLKFYALYKLATVGPCAVHGGTQPWAVQLVARSKWDAWNALGDISSEEAMTQYINALMAALPEGKQKAAFLREYSM